LQVRWECIGEGAQSHSTFRVLWRDTYKLLDSLFNFHNDNKSAAAAAGAVPQAGIVAGDVTGWKPLYIKHDSLEADFMFAPLSTKP
jgi:hypothetical protein